jgi:hypothetical protein
MRTRATGIVLGLVLTGFGFAATIALASPTTQQYDTTTVQTVTSQSVGKFATSQQVPSSGTLPFTGMTLLWIVVFGAALLVLGLVLRRFGRRSSSS